MQPKFNPPVGGSPAVLLCPACGFEYLHHNKVEVFERSEDEEKGVHITVQAGTAVFDPNLDGNPSQRRHGLRIEFWCEGCHAVSTLTLAQSKGWTLVDFIAGQLPSEEALEGD